MTTLHPRLPLLALIAALGAVAIGLWFASSGEDAPDPGLNTQAAAASERSRPTAALAAALAGSAPASVEEAARLLQLGASGDVIVDVHTRGALDVLLSMLGPDASAADLQRLEDALRRSLPGEAATQAIDLVRRYEAYHRASTTQAATQAIPSSPEEVKSLLEKAQALRRQHFDDATARALFGAEEEQTRISMAMNEIQADPKLSEQEKAAKINALRESAPRDLPGLAATTSPSLQAMDTQIAALRQQGATPAQIEQVRARYLGEEAARAMTDMEAQRADWESRYQAYLQQKQTIMATGATDTAAQLEAALRQHFKEEELAAARAYDRHRTATP